MAAEAIGKLQPPLTDALRRSLLDFVKYDSPIVAYQVAKTLNALNPTGPTAEAILKANRASFSDALEGPESTFDNLATNLQVTLPRSRVETIDERAITCPENR